MDIEDLLKDQPPMFSFKTDALGTLCCFNLSFSVCANLGNKYSNNQDSDIWVRGLLSLSCVTENCLREGQFKPDIIGISDKNVLRLSELELEKFAALYVENDPYLKKANEGQDKNDNESNATYLRRLYENWGSGLAISPLSKLATSAWADIAKISNAARATDVLSRSTLASIAELKNKEAEVLKGISLNRPQVPTAPPYIPNPAVESVAQLKNLTELIIDSNDVQEKIAKDIAKAVKEARQSTRTNMLISIAIIILTGAGLWLTYWIAQSNSEQMNSFMGRVEQNSAVIVKPLASLNDSNKASAEVYSKLAEAISSLNEEIAKLRESQAVNERAKAPELVEQ